MMRHTNYALVGAFVIVLGLAMVAGVLWLAMGGTTGEFVRYHTDMTESVSGLSVDAPVKYRGVDVGRVVEIDIDPEEDQQVRLLIDVRAGTPVKVDSIAVLEFQGITGVAFLNLTGGSTGSALLLPTEADPVPEITAGPSLLLRLDEGISRLLLSFTATSDRIQQLLGDDNQAAVRASLADLASLLRELDASAADLRSAISGAAETFESTRDIGTQAGAAFTSVEEAAAAFEQMSVELERTSILVRAVVDDSNGEFMQLADTMERQVRMLSSDLRRLSERLDRLAVTIEEDPSRIIYGPEAEELGPGEEP